MRAAILDEEGNVINVILVTSLSEAPGAMNGEGVNIGDKWNGAEFIPSWILNAPPESSQSQESQQP